MQVGFRLTSNKDPEERLEEAALWKALHDEYGSAICATNDVSVLPPDIPVFGRITENPRTGTTEDGRLCIAHANPVSSRMDYWDDPAFLSRAGRVFSVEDFSGAERAVEDLHRAGKTAFIKSTRAKQYLKKIPPGVSFRQALGDMAYSFIDGTRLMVQEYVGMEYEHRYFVIGRKIVTSSPNHPSLTPIDYPLPKNAVVRSPVGSCVVIERGDVVGPYMDFVSDIAREMREPHAVIDVATVRGRPVVVEFNPMQLGQVGLFACNVRALAEASVALVRDFQPLYMTIVDRVEEGWNGDVSRAI